MDILDLSFYNNRELNPTYLNYLIDFEQYPDSLPYEWVSLDESRLLEYLDYLGAPHTTLNHLGKDYLSIACYTNPSILKKILRNGLNLEHWNQLIAKYRAISSGNVKLVEVLEQYFNFEPITNINIITTPEMLDWAISRNLIRRHKILPVAGLVNHKDIIFGSGRVDRATISNIIIQGHYETLKELNQDIKFRAVDLVNSAKSGNPRLYFDIKLQVQNYKKYILPNTMISAAIYGGSPTIMSDVVADFGLIDKVKLDTSSEVYFSFLRDLNYEISHLHQAIKCTRFDTTEIVADLIYVKHIFPTIETLKLAVNMNKLKAVQLIMGRLGKQPIYNIENLNIAIKLTR